MGQSSVQFSDHCLPGPLTAPARRSWGRLRELGAAWMGALVMMRPAAGRRGAFMDLDADGCTGRGVSPRLWRRHSAYLVYRQEARVAGAARRVPHGGAIWAGGGAAGAGRDA